MITWMMPFDQMHDAYVIMHHQVSPRVFKCLQASSSSSSVFKRLQASSSIFKHLQASSSIFKHLQVSSCVFSRFHDTFMTLLLDAIASQEETPVGRSVITFKNQPQSVGQSASQPFNCLNHLVV